MKILPRKILPPYPYHIHPKAIIQDLVDFPLQFYSKDIDLNNIDRILNYFHAKMLKDASRSCGLFLSLLANNRIQDLEDLCEWNLYKKIKDSMISFKGQGYAIKSIGDIERSKTIYLGRTKYIGNLLPYRNLNLPKSNYKILQNSLPDFRKNREYYSFRFFSKHLQGYKDRGYDDKMYSLDLKNLNKLDDISPFKEHLANLRMALKFRSIHMYVLDVGFTSSFKLLVVDKDGNIVEGDENPEKLEFHSFRLERVMHNKWFFKKSRRAEWMKSNFKGIFNEFTISDVDGFMDGNPFTK
ncbi:unnamed protein product [Blepharisma stoltei]|uniref:Uncharacterized protein n=1 Tax=Blepharisma stoltei TaxID=1481888 RepID=A0AAU9JM47_9CILI|nr:unnamed protein product [Blepharisma stoltei]